MPPTFVYAMALLPYLALGAVVLAIAGVMALFPKTRPFGTRLAVAMVASYPGVLFYQLIAAPLVFAIILFWAGVFRFLRPTDSLEVAAYILLLISTVGVFGIASLVGFTTGWRFGWRLADVEWSAREAFAGDPVWSFVARLRSR